MVKHDALTFEYNQVTPYIFLGTNLCCATHFKKSLLKKGIKADVSLEKKKLDQPFGVEYYLWLPTTDHLAPSLKQLYIGVRFLEEVIKQKTKCYVHCQRGHGRAPTLVAAYLVAQGRTVEEAFAFIKKKRKSVHPNKKQIARVKQFAKVYDKKRNNMK
jgi:protein-tyrosine phosphatase